MAHRRSAEEWASLIGQLERSKQTVTAFARARGIRPETLSWWRWRLGNKAKAGATRRTHASRDRVKLIAVQPTADPGPRDCIAATPVWELIAPSGHELRVYDPRGLAVLKAALFAVTGVRRR